MFSLCASVAVGFLIGGIYITNIGLYFLDVVDQFVSNVGMLFVGFMEAFSAGWIYRLEEYKEISGERAVYLLTVSLHENPPSTLTLPASFDY